MPKIQRVYAELRFGDAMLKSRLFVDVLGLHVCYIHYLIAAVTTGEIDVVFCLFVSNYVVCKFVCCDHARLLTTSRTKE